MSQIFNPLSNKKSRPLWIAIALFCFSVFLSLKVSPAFYGLSSDREGFRYIGMLIYKGGLPYRDIFDLKAPLIYFLYALLHPFGIWGVWTFETVLFGFTCVGLYAFARHRNWIFPLVYPLIFAVLMRTGFFFSGGGLTRGYTAYMSIIAFCLAGTTIRIRFFLTGLLVSLTLLMQQSEILAITLVVLPLLFERGKISFLRSASEFGIGVILPLLCLGIWLTHHQLWGDFVDQTYYFGVNYYNTGEPWRFKMGMGRFLEMERGLWWPMVLGSVIGALFVLRRGQSAVWYVALGLALVAASYAVGYSMRNYDHYLVSIVPYLVLLISFCLDDIQKFPQKIIRPVYLTSAMLLVFCFLLPLRFLPSHLTETVDSIRKGPWDGYTKSIDQKILAEVSSVRGQKGQFFPFQWGSMTVINTELEIVGPTKFMFTRPLYLIPSWDKDGKLFMGILESLEKYKTKYVLDHSHHPRLKIRDDLKVLWEDYMQKHYTVMSRIEKDDVRFFVRKDTSETKVAQIINQ